MTVPEQKEEAKAWLRYENCDVFSGQTELRYISTDWIYIL